MDELRPLRSSERDPLARLLEHGAGLEVEYDVEAGLARHLHLVQTVPITAPIAAATRRGWWAMGGGVVVAGLTTAWLAASQPLSSPSATVGPPTVVAVTQPVVPSAASIATTVPVPGGTTLMAKPDVVIADAPVAKAAATVGEVSTPRAKRAASPAASRRDAAPAVETPGDVAPTIDDSVVREAANVKEARRRLASGDFAGAIATCDRGDGEFPSGVLGVERDGLRVLARLRRDADASARGRAASYLAAHPTGPVSEQIRDAL